MCTTPNSQMGQLSIGEITRQLQADAIAFDTSRSFRQFKKRSSPANGLSLDQSSARSCARSRSASPPGNDASNRA